MSASWSIIEYRGLEELEQLRPDWNRLVAQMPDHGFHHLYETHAAYFAHMPSPHGEFTCLALTDGRQVRAICPIEPDVVTILGRPTRVLGLPLGQQDLSRDVICPADEAAAALLPTVVAHLRHQPGPSRWLVFARVPERSALSRCLPSLGAAAFCADPDAPVFEFDCRRQFEELAARLPAKFRRNLRAAHRHLQKLGEPRFVAADDPGTVAAAFETFLAIEASGWKRDAGTTVEQRPGHLAMYRHLAGALHGADRCEIAALYLADRCIASLLCIRAGTEYAALKIGYDETAAEVSPGHLLLEWVLRRCCDDPAVTRLNMAGNAAWLQPWRPGQVAQHTVYIPLDRRLSPVLAVLRMRLWAGPRLKRLAGRRGGG